MPNPSQTLATLRPDLSDSLMEFDLQMNMDGFISTDIFKTIDVDRESGNFGRIPLAQLLQKGQTLRSPGSNYNRGNFTFEPETFACVEHGWEEPVDDRESKIYADYFTAELVATNRARSMVMVNAEQRVANTLFNETTFAGGQQTAAGTPWYNTSADPIANVNAAVDAVYDRTGLWADTLVINRKTFRALRNVDKIKDAIASVGAGDPAKLTDITINMLAQVFDLPKVLVAGGTKNTAAEGLSASPAQIWSDSYAMVCVSANTGSIREPCIGRVFNYTGDGGSANGTVEEYRDETVRGNVIRVRRDTDEKMLYKECGQLLTGIKS